MVDTALAEGEQMGIFYRFKAGATERVTARQFGELIANVALRGGFHGDECVWAYISRADPLLEDSIRLRTDVLVFCLFPLDLIVATAHPTYTDRIRKHMLDSSVRLLRLMLDNPDDSEVAWDEVPKFITGRFASYAQILMPKLTGGNYQKLCVQAYQNISNVPHTTGLSHLTIHFTTAMKRMPAAIRSFHIIGV